MMDFNILSNQAVVSTALACHECAGTSEMLQQTLVFGTPTAALSGVELGKVARNQIARHVDSFSLLRHKKLTFALRWT
jgi:hypothetical protein